MVDKQNVMQDTSGIATECSGDLKTNSKKRSLTSSDIRHNMIVCVMLDVIFSMGWADLNIAMQPLLVYLKASNTIIGLVTGAQFMMIPGLFISPFISRNYPIKKWYLFITQVPYLGAIGVIGAVLAYSGHMDTSRAWLLGFVTFTTLLHMFFAGFVSLPHQEYIAACIPMSHRGRYTGYSFSIGGVTALITSAIGGVLLLKMAKPMSFGYLYLMTWFICQGGYVFSLFGRERPVPVDNAPRAWSKGMLKAAWNDKPFVNLMLITLLGSIFFAPALSFVTVYGYKELKMAAATAALIQMITQAVRIFVSAPLGALSDKLGPKRVLPVWTLVSVLSLIVVVVMKSQTGVLVAVGIASVASAGSFASMVSLQYGIPSPENRSGHYTIMLILSYASLSLGPIIFGRILDIVSYTTVFSICAVIGVLFYIIQRRLLKRLSDNVSDYS